MAHRSCLLTEPRQQFQALHVCEDRIVRHERNLQPDCRRGHPTIRLMFLLAQAVPSSDTPGTKRGICLRQVRSWPHDFCPGYLTLQAPEPVRAPAGQPGTILKFGDGDEGDDRWSAFEDGPVARRQ